MRNNKDLNHDYFMGLAEKFVKDAERNAEINPTSDTIQIVVVEPNIKPYKKTIPNTLEAMREIVGGQTDILFFGQTATGAHLAIVVNKESKAQDFPFNTRLVSKKGGIEDILLGTFFITAYNFKGEEVSLSDGQCATYIKRFSSTEVYI